MIKKHYFNLLFFSIFFLLFSHSIFAETTKKHFVIQHWVLNNKTKVFFVQRKEIPILDVAVVFKAGSLYDNKLLGLSALTNKMLGEGAGKLSANDIANRFESVGAVFNTFSNRDMAGITLRTLTIENVLNTSLDTLKIVLTKPTIPVDALTRNKKYIDTELRLNLENPWEVAKDSFYSTLYKNFPYANNPKGNLNTIKNITVKNVMDFYSQYYTGNNAYLILVGDLSLDQAKKISENLLGALPEGKPIKKFQAVSKQEKPITKIVNMPTQQVSIILGQVGIGPNNSDYFPLMVGNAVLGGLPLSSILYKKIREDNGLAYFASSSFNLLSYNGPFAIGLQTSASNQDKTIALLNNILKDYINSGPSKAQLASAKKNLIGHFPLSISSNKLLLNKLVELVFYDFPLDYLDTYQNNVDAISIDQTKNAFQKEIDINKLTTVIVGPKK